MEYAKLSLLGVVTDRQRELLNDALTTELAIKDEQVPLKEYIDNYCDIMLEKIDYNSDEFKQNIRIYVKTRHASLLDSNNVDLSAEMFAEDLSMEIVNLLLFTVPILYKYNKTLALQILTDLSKELKEIIDTFDLVCLHDWFDSIDTIDSEKQLSIYARSFFGQVGIKFDNIKFKNGKLYHDYISQTYALTIGSTDDFKNDDFILDGMDHLNDPFYKYLIEIGKTKPSDALKEIHYMLSHINIKLGFNNDNIEKHSYLRNYDVPIKSKKSKEYLEKYVIPLLYDNVNHTLIFRNYHMFGLHNEIISYLVDQKYEVHVFYGRLKKVFGSKESKKSICLTFVEPKPSSQNDKNPFMMMVQQNEKPKPTFANEQKDYYKTIVIDSNEEPEVDDKIGIRYINCETIDIIKNPNIYTSMLSYSMKNIYNLPDYRNVSNDINAYVTMHSTGFMNIKDLVINNSEELIKKIRMRYDDSSTNLVEAFVKDYKDHLNTIMIKKPFAFLLYGDTGSGKTYFAKVLAKNIFKSSDKLTIFSMSQFIDKHDFIAKMLGAPVGYVGCNEKTELEKFISTNIDTGGIILFDECDKCKSTEQMDALLNILNDGYIEFNGLDAQKYNISKFVFVFCGNYNVNIKSNATNLFNLSAAFQGRMKFKRKIVNGEDRNKMVSSVINDLVNEAINTLDENIEINVTIADNVLEIPKLKDRKINGREMNSTISKLFHKVIDNILLQVQSNGKRDFHIEYKDKKINIS